MEVIARHAKVHTYNNIKINFIFIFYEFTTSGISRSECKFHTRNQTEKKNERKRYIIYF